MPTTDDDLSPLVHIERAVQERAGSAALDMSAGDAEAALRRLVVAEVDQWNLDHQRGLRPYGLPDRPAVISQVLRNVAGYGPLQALLG